MTDKNESTIIEAGVTLTDAQKQSISDGVDWVKNWYQKRHKAGMFLDGADIGADVEEYKTAMENLGNLQIVATKDMYGTLEKMILEGKIHLKDEVIAQFGGDEKQAIAAMLLVNEKKKNDPRYEKAAGLSFSYVKEKVLFLNVPLIDKEAQNVYAPSLSSAVAHEVTHTLGLQINEMMTAQLLENGGLREGVAPHAYLDNPKEVYARIKELCKNFDIDPTKEITLDEVKKIREECEKKRTDYEKNGGNAPKKLDNHLFDRYTDDKIVELINYTALNDAIFFDDYKAFRSAAKADLALSRHKISAAEKAANKGVAKEENVAQKEKTDDRLMQAMRDDRGLA